MGFLWTVKTLFRTRLCGSTCAPAEAEAYATIQEVMSQSRYNTLRCFHMVGFSPTNKLRRATGRRPELFSKLVEAKDRAAEARVENTGFPVHIDEWQRVRNLNNSGGASSSSNAVGSGLGSNANSRDPVFGVVGSLRASNVSSPVGCVGGVGEMRFNTTNYANVPSSDGE